MPLFHIDDYFGDGRLGSNGTNVPVFLPSVRQWAEEGTCKDCTTEDIPSLYPVDWKKVNGATMLTTTIKPGNTEATINATFTGRCR